MKVYERKYSDFRYPDDMKKIMDYLNERGKINVSAKTIEDLYYDFSDRSCAVWLYVDDDILKDFEEWLTEVDI